MGKHCFNSGALDRSLEWFEEAWYLAGKEGNETLRQDQVHTFLDHAAKKVTIKQLLIINPIYFYPRKRLILYFLLFNSMMNVL